jgi:hypothetical protein
MSEANLTVRKVYGRDRIRLLRCRTCGEEFWGSRSFGTKNNDPLEPIVFAGF